MSQATERWAVVRPQNKGEFYLKWQGHYWAGLIAFSLGRGGGWYYKDDDMWYVGTDDMGEWWEVMETVFRFHVRPAAPGREEYLVMAEMPFPCRPLVLGHKFKSQDEAIRFLNDMYESTTSVWEAEVYIGDSTLVEYRMERGLL